MKIEIGDEFEQLYVSRRGPGTRVRIVSKNGYMDGWYFIYVDDPVSDGLSWDYTDTFENPSDYRKVEKAAEPTETDTELEDRAHTNAAYLLPLGQKLQSAAAMALDMGIPIEQFTYFAEDAFNSTAAELGSIEKRLLTKYKAGIV